MGYAAGSNTLIEYVARQGLLHFFPWRLFKAGDAGRLLDVASDGVFALAVGSDSTALPFPAAEHRVYRRHAKEPWQQVDTGLTTGALEAAVWGNGLFVLGGGNGDLTDPFNISQPLLMRFDSVHVGADPMGDFRLPCWGEVEGFDIDDVRVRIHALAWNGSVFCAAASDKVYRSVNDGLNWSLHAVPAGMLPRAILARGARFILFGEAGRIATSDDDGQTWIERVSPVAVALHGASQNGAVVVAVGEATGAGAAIVSSVDNGVTWVQRANPENLALRGVAALSSSRFLAAGDYFSPDRAYALLGSPQADQWTRITIPFDLRAEQVRLLGKSVFVPGGSDDPFGAPHRIAWHDNFR